MKITSAALLSLLALAPTAAMASSFEACDLVAEIRRSSETAAIEGSTAYEFEVTVTSAARARDGGERSDSDCSDQVGKRMQLDLVLGDSAGVPKAGDRVAFSRVAEEEVGGGGSINYEFQALNPPPAAGD